MQVGKGQVPREKRRGQECPVESLGSPKDQEEEKIRKEDKKL
jgi:hypothetical protein